MTPLGQIYNAAVSALLATRCNGNAGLARDGTTASRVATANAITYSIDGVAYTKAATGNLPFSSGHVVQAANTTRYYVAGLDASGALVTVQGAAGGAVPGDKVPAAVCPIGIIKIATTVAFEPNTTALNAGGVTATFTSVAVLPANDRP